MKAERRQELKTNELAQMLEDSREFFREWGSYIVGGVVIIGLVVAFAVYRAKASEEQLTEAWKSLQTISLFDAKGEKKSDEEVRQGFARLQELAAGDRGPDFIFEVLSTQAQSAVRLATASKEGLDTMWLDKAADAYEAMRTRLPDNRLAVAMALNGLADIEADRFVVDGDINRKSTALGLLEKLKDDPRFNGTPFQRAALERINKLDEVFRRVEFAAAPAPITVPVAPDLPTPLLPPGFVPEPAPAPTPPPVEAPPVEAPPVDAPVEAPPAEAPSPDPSTEKPIEAETPPDASPDADPDSTEPG
jgi:hypothetical protein